MAEYASKALYIPSKMDMQALKLRENKTILQSPRERILSTEFGSSGRNLDSYITVKVQRLKYNRRKQAKEEEEEVLVVHGIDVQSDEYVKFDVYINLVDESIVSPSFSEFVGTFVHIPHGKRDANGKTNLKLGISEVLEDLEADSDESIWVTLIPRTKSCTYTIIDGLQIEYMR
ncbi:hypothetical protein PRUPE_8G095500 [Prunus persica]|uniref:Polyphenol oxidase C-terminal domain-containing protein n=1 Tax=Prunus persica TaxID=3760 RepID=A0A251MVM8_PRUPE|nr:hypothetical protein PRUPE_8G095500 [Prunus persica]